MRLFWYPPKTVDYRHGPYQLGGKLNRQSTQLSSIISQYPSRNPIIKPTTNVQMQSMTPYQRRVVFIIWYGWAGHINKSHSYFITSQYHRRFVRTQPETCRCNSWILHDAPNRKFVGKCLTILFTASLALQWSFEIQANGAATCYL